MKGTLQIGSVLLVLLATYCTRITARVTYGLTSYTPDPNMWFLIQNRDTGKCVDVVGSPGTARGTNAQTFQCEYPHRTNTDQVWRRDSHGRLVNRVSGMCLDVNRYPATSANALNILVVQCGDVDDPNTDHLWDFEFEPTQKYVHIRNRKTNKCLDVAGDRNPANGVNIQQQDCEHHGNINTDHWWQIIPIDSCMN